MGRSSEAKDRKNPKKVKCDGRRDAPTDRRTDTRTNTHTDTHKQTNKHTNTYLTNDVCASLMKM